MKPALHAGWDADTLARTLSGLGVTPASSTAPAPTGAERTDAGW